MQEKIWKVVIFALAAIAFFGVPFSMFAFGSDLQTRQATLYPYRSTVELQDDFISGSSGSGDIGALGWVATGTLTNRDSETNRPGIFRLDTGAVSGTASRISLPVSAAIDPSNNNQITWVIRLNTNDANTTLRIGLGNSVAGNPPANGIYFEKLAANTNWFCVTRSSSTETRTDTGVAATTNFDTFFIRENSTTAQFRLNGASVCTHSTNIPTTFVSPWVFIINTAAASKTVDLDYVQFDLNGLSR